MTEVPIYHINMNLASRFSQHPSAPAVTGSFCIAPYPERSNPGTGLSFPIESNHFDYPPLLHSWPLDCCTWCSPLPSPSLPTWPGSAWSGPLWTHPDSPASGCAPLHHTEESSCPCLSISFLSFLCHLVIQGKRGGQGESGKSPLLTRGWPQLGVTRE